MAFIQNPILPGFHPDPSIVRAGEDYYIATSTFEWFPGVAIHHSRDLVHWRHAGYPLTRRSQLDLRGDLASLGVWAPCLSHDGQLFHLIYSDMKSFRNWFWDMDNFLVTAPAIGGPWSEPVYLNSTGFDPSLFHDTDGRKWLVEMAQDPRPGGRHFNGIVLHEYDPGMKRLIGPSTCIFQGTELDYTEGPHLYKHDGLYYLLCAEGGTGYGHAAIFARSRRIEGPYEIDPGGPMLTSRDTDTVLQRAGHASLVETQTGEWYLAHLCGRPIEKEGQRLCLLGRETAIQKVMWNADGWLRLAEGGRTPSETVPAPALPPHPFPAPPERDDFDAPVLSPYFQTRREPADATWLSLAERPGHLRLRGGMSPYSCFRQSLVGRRIQSVHCEAETALEFNPPSHLQFAGLLAYYNEDGFFWLRVSRDERLGKCIDLWASELNEIETPMERVSVEDWPRVHMKCVLDGLALRFYYGPDGQEWIPAGPEQDASLLTDEGVKALRFTGAFFALNAVDIAGTRCPADFDFFAYRERG